MSEILEADLTWTGHAFEPDIQIEIGEEGRIRAAGRLGLESRRLEKVALLPGFVNAHSHAFQRALRGRGETFGEGRGDFWSWREAMYHFIESAGEEEFFSATRGAFREMRRAGITTVGEFHYLHHAREGDDFALDRLVVSAAESAGIRLVLLQTFYATGGIGKPLESAQQRFRLSSLEDYWRSYDALAHHLAGTSHQLGVVAHSIRAASLEDVVSLHEESRRRGAVFHMHVEEQQQEIDDAVARYGATPLQLLLRELKIDGRFTAVHCTRSQRSDLENFFRSGGRLCVTPLTEANLGDGIPPHEPLLSNRGLLALGSDSNARISMLEEMRWLEYTQRLATRSRGIYRDERGSVAAVLLQIATAGGARSLGVNAGSITPGAWADLVAIDLDSPLLAGAGRRGLADALVFGASEQVIKGTAVGGEWNWGDS